MGLGVLGLVGSLWWVIVVPFRLYAVNDASAKRFCLAASDVLDYGILSAKSVGLVAYLFYAGFGFADLLCFHRRSFLW